MHEGFRGRASWIYGHEMARVSAVRGGALDAVTALRTGDEQGLALGEAMKPFEDVDATQGNPLHRVTAGAGRSLWRTARCKGSSGVPGRVARPQRLAGSAKQLGDRLVASENQPDELERDATGRALQGVRPLGVAPLSPGKKADSSPNRHRASPHRIDHMPGRDWR